ncbi:hypothetical protein B0H17DRAFT_1148752 [Mycena rosella]|uniref:Uncharacterized protein n=1 Tax=Mycena rosella TaxID=1033263 RepID=A0AAD7FTY4_MYCRO|nr:hypothetical protein B0H17DRAFT_1148752 [Mycena rosella]
MEGTRCTCRPYYPPFHPAEVGASASGNEKYSFAWRGDRRIAGDDEGADEGGGWGVRPVEGLRGERVAGAGDDKGESGGWGMLPVEGLRGERVAGAVGTNMNRSTRVRLRIGARGSAALAAKHASVVASCNLKGARQPPVGSKRDEGRTQRATPSSPPLRSPPPSSSFASAFLLVPLRLAIPIHSGPTNLTRIMSARGRVHHTSFARRGVASGACPGSCLRWHCIARGRYPSPPRILRSVPRSSRTRIQIRRTAPAQLDSSRRSGAGRRGCIRGRRRAGIVPTLVLRGGGGEGEGASSAPRGAGVRGVAGDATSAPCASWAPSPSYMASSPAPQPRVIPCFLRTPPRRRHGRAREPRLRQHPRGVRPRPSRGFGLARRDLQSRGRRACESMMERRTSWSESGRTHARRAGGIVQKPAGSVPVKAISRMSGMSRVSRPDRRGLHAYGGVRAQGARRSRAWGRRRAGGGSVDDIVRGDDVAATRGECRGRNPDVVRARTEARWTALGAIRVRAETRTRGVQKLEGAGANCGAINGRNGAFVEAASSALVSTRRRAAPPHKSRGTDGASYNSSPITKFVEAIKGPCDLGKFRQGFDASRKPLTRLSQARQQLAKPSLAFWRVFKPLSPLIQALAHLPRDRLSEPPLILMPKCYACGTFCQPGRGLTNHYGKCSTLKAQHAEGAAYANSVDAEAEAAAAAAAAVSVLPDPPADMDFETIDSRPPTPPPLRPSGRPPRRIRLPKRYRDDPPDAPAPVPPPPPVHEEAEVPAEPAPGTAPATWVKTEPNKYGLYKIFPNRPTHDPDDSISSSPTNLSLLLAPRTPGSPS